MGFVLPFIGSIIAGAAGAASAIGAAGLTAAGAIGTAALSGATLAYGGVTALGGAALTGAQAAYGLGQGALAALGPGSVAAGGVPGAGIGGIGTAAGGIGAAAPAVTQGITGAGLLKGLGTAASLASGVSSVAQARAASQQAREAGRRADKAGSIYDAEHQRFLDYYAPVERQLAGQTLAGAPADYYSERAGNDVQQQVAQTYDAAARELGRAGGDPSTVGFAANMQDIQRAGALAEAGARTNARGRVEQQNFARRLDFLRTGHGLPTKAAAGISSDARTQYDHAQNSARAAADMASSGITLGKYIAGLGAPKPVALPDAPPPVARPMRDTNVEPSAVVPPKPTNNGWVT